MLKIFFLSLLLFVSCATSNTRKVVIELMVDVSPDGSPKNVRVINEAAMEKLYVKKAMDLVKEYKFNTNGDSLKDHKVTFDFDAVE